MTDTKASCRCASCGWQGLQDATKPISHLLSRVQAGEMMPAGECPRCAGLVQLTDLPPQTLSAAASAMRQRGWIAISNEAPHPMGVTFERKSHPVFVGVTTYQGDVKGPAWLRFTLDKEFIDRLSMLANMVQQGGLHTITDYSTPEWEYDGNVLIMQTMLVTTEAFLWQAYIAGKNGRVESDPVDFHELSCAAAQTQDGEPIFMGMIDPATKLTCLDSLELFEQAA
jgi:hypothetical protein